MGQRGKVPMSIATSTLTADIKRLTAELKHLEKRFQSEPTPDPAALVEFRHAVDGVRLAAWSVSEMINVHQNKSDPDTVLSFLAAERLRRFEQLVRSIRGDIERRVVTFKTNGMTTLCHSVNMLHAVLDECLKEHRLQKQEQKTPT
jgi:hypothetical protein